MINDKMDTEAIILDLSTRASNFCKDLVVFQDKNITLKFDVEKDIACVSISSQRSVSDFWQVWFEVWVDGTYYLNKKFDGNIQEGRTLREALVQLDGWLDMQEDWAWVLLEDGAQITESIGFGD
jgi:hypothetical protein